MLVLLSLPWTHSEKDNMTNNRSNYCLFHPVQENEINSISAKNDIDYFDSKKVRILYEAVLPTLPNIIKTRPRCYTYLNEWHWITMQNLWCFTSLHSNVAFRSIHYFCIHRTENVSQMWTRWIFLSGQKHEMRFPYDIISTLTRAQASVGTNTWCLHKLPVQSNYHRWCHNHILQRCIIFYYNNINFTFKRPIIFGLECVEF